MLTIDRRSLPIESVAQTWSKTYSSFTHLAGSVEDFTSAKMILGHFETHFNVKHNSQPIFSAGSSASRNATLHLTSPDARPSAWIDVYYPVLNVPLKHSVEILGSDGEPLWSAQLEEVGDPLDEDAHRLSHQVPIFHGLSKDGSAEGQLIYANYGSQEVISRPPLSLLQSL